MLGRFPIANLSHQRAQTRLKTWFKEKNCARQAGEKKRKVKEKARASPAHSIHAPNGLASIAGAPQIPAGSGATTL